jgi:hypothetical protein
VQAALDGPVVVLRDSDDPDAVVRVPMPAWEAFIEGVRRGEFDKL